MKITRRYGRPGMIGVFLSFLAGGLLTSGPLHSADANTHFETARRAQAAGKWDEAIRHYQAVLTLRGDDAAVRHNLALIYLAFPDLNRARPQAERAVALGPKEGRYAITLAVIILSGAPRAAQAALPVLAEAEDLLKGAVRNLEKARDHQGLATAYYNLGTIAQRRNQHKKARDWYRQALRKNPDDRKAQDALEDLGSLTD